jgi:pimeloyl-ACP methyl ester carboxylesterase
MNRFLTPTALIFTSVLLTACGGGSSSSSTFDDSQDPITVVDGDTNTDADTDGDGTVDSQDAFPSDPNEDTDTDGDGIGNNADSDDDDDGVSDSDDAFPENNNEDTDTDGDGVGDNSDTCPATDSSEPSNNVGCSAAQFDHASCSGNFNIDGGRSYQVVLPYTDDNDSVQRISFQVLEPTNFNCTNIANGAHPLMLHGPGYGGGRSSSGFDNYRNDGYTVISLDPRGFGDSSGSVKVMDAQYEGRYFITVLDWVEQNLDYLAWRNESTQDFISRPNNATSVADGDNLVIGSQGGSYGGGYQLLLVAVDAKKRLDAIAPDITWHDVRDALNPGDAIKTVWSSALTAIGASSGYQSFLSEDTLSLDNSTESKILDNGPDPFIQETLARGLATNEWPRQSLDWFQYRGAFGAWCEASALPTLPYPSYGIDAVPMIDANGAFNNPDKQVNGDIGYGEFIVQPTTPTQYLAGLDVLLTQGMTDTLFNFNHAWWNRQCLNAAGADVSLYTHNSGHVLPIAQSPDQISVDAGSCGFYSSAEQKAWFDARLNPLNGSTSELPANTAKETCFALGTIDDEGASDTVELAAMDVLAPGANTNFTVRQITPPTPVPNGTEGYLNLSGSSPVIAPLGDILVENGAILVGIPHLTVTVSSLTGLNEIAQDCSASDAPIPGCDSITFVGIGKKVVQSGSNSPNFTLIDDQIQPIRGLGEHDIDLVGIAERLQQGDELAVLFYAVHPQFASSASRDLTIPAVNISGTVALPLYVTGTDGQPDLNADATTLLPSEIEEAL